MLRSGNDLRESQTVLWDLLSKYCHLLNFLGANGPEKVSGKNGGTGPGICPKLAVCTMNKSVGDLGASLAVTASLTSPLFNFRKKIRQELSNVEILQIHGPAILYRGLEKVRRLEPHMAIGTVPTTSGVISPHCHQFFFIFWQANEQIQNANSGGELPVPSVGHDPLGSLQSLCADPGSLKV